MNGLIARTLYSLQRFGLHHAAPIPSNAGAGSGRFCRVPGSMVWQAGQRPVCRQESNASRRLSAQRRLPALRMREAIQGIFLNNAKETGLP